MSDRDLSHSAPLSGSRVEFCAERNVLAWRVVEPDAPTRGAPSTFAEPTSRERRGRRDDSTF